MSLKSILAASVAAQAILLAAAPAMAQQDGASAADEAAAASPGAEADGAEIIVTGSRVARRGFDAPTPTRVLTAEAIEQRGAPNVGDFLNEVPSFRVSQNAQTNPQTATASGQVYVDLRALGNIRTLVLVDGRRHVPSSSTGQVDLNLIPTILVDRIDVVTGGASAAYGSDAVSGVVNIIINTRLEGFRGDLALGLSDHGDNFERRISLGFGTSFADNRGHIVIGGDYVRTDGVTSYYDRDWGRRGDEIVSFANNRPADLPSRIYAPGVRYTNSSPGGTILGVNADTNAANGADVLRGIEFLPGGAIGRFSYGNDPGVGSAYDFTTPDGIPTRLGHQLILPINRHVVLAHLDYDVTDNIAFFVEGSYARSGSSFNGTAVRDTATSGSAAVIIRRDNAFLPAEIGQIMDANNIASFPLGRWNGDWAQAKIDNYSTTYRIAGGLSGTIGDWSWDAYYQYGRNVYEGRINNIRIAQNFQWAYDAIRLPSGQIVCRNETARAQGCVPLNLFGAGSPSQEAVNYVNGTLFNEVTTTQQVVAVNLRGNPFSTWAGPVGVAVGAEYRRDSAIGVVDSLSEARAYSYGNYQPFSGAFTTKEAYAEMVVPIASDLPFAHMAELNGAIRYTDYGSRGGVTTWKLGAIWEVVQGLRFRGTRSRDIRAPNAAELFSEITNLTSLRNPFSGVTTPTRVFSGASPGLRPERADTLTLGAVLTPRFIPGLTLAADYYDIDIGGAIASYGGQVILDRCFAEVQAGTPGFFCGFVARSGSGAATTIDSVTTALLNIASLKTRGVDFELSYRTRLGAGSLTTRISGTYTDRLISDDGLGSGPSFNAQGIIQARGSVIDRAGQVGGFTSGANIGSTSVPHWQLAGSLTYTDDRFSTTMQARYVGGGKVDNNLVDPSDPDYDPRSPISVGPQDVSGRLYLNWSGSINLLRDGERRLQVYGVINNLTNVDPPFPATQLSGLFDRLGRFYRLGVRFSY